MIKPYDQLNIVIQVHNGLSIAGRYFRCEIVEFFILYYSCYVLCVNEKGRGYLYINQLIYVINDKLCRILIMKKRALSLIPVILVSLVSGSALAASESINTRLKNQESRIQKGCEKGQLTKDEKKILRKEQEQIKLLIKRLSSDQKFSSKDKKKVHLALTQARVNIFTKRYNKKNKKNNTK